jgi:hypothetical protein
MNHHPSTQNGRRRWLRTGGALGLLTACLLPVVAGIRGLEINLAVARIRMETAQPGIDERDLRQALESIKGFRRARIAPRGVPGSRDWRVEVEFRAASMTEASFQFEEWRRQVRLPVRLTGEQLTYQTLRLRRPARGDLVFGVAQTLRREDLNDARTDGETSPAGVVRE